MCGRRKTERKNAVNGGHLVPQARQAKIKNFPWRRWGSLLLRLQTLDPPLSPTLTPVEIVSARVIGGGVGSKKLVQAACIRCHGTKCPIKSLKNWPLIRSPFALIRSPFALIRSPFALIRSPLSCSYFSPRRGYRRVLKFVMEF
jgi:hypothetical protein